MFGGAVLGCGDGGGEALKTLARQVVYRVIWEAGYLVGGPDGAHGLPPPRKRTSKRGVWLIFATVVIDCENIFAPISLDIIIVSLRLREKRDMQAHLT